MKTDVSDRPPDRESVARDIETREDIDTLMRTFYGRAMSDDRIGYFFTEVVRLDLVEHLPMIGDFWETLLFNTTAYRQHGRNPLVVHAELDRKSPLEPEHFERWLELFIASVELHFSGPRAEFVKSRSRAIAARMLDYVLRDRAAG